MSLFLYIANDNLMKINEMEKSNKYSLKIFGNKDLPAYLLERHNVVRMIVFTTIYSLIFINIFKPFNSVHWIPNSNSTNYLMYSSLMVITGMVVISISRLIMHFFVKKIQIGYAEYVAWLIFEAFALAAFYVFIGYKFGFVDNYLTENPEATIWVALFNIYIKAAANTVWMLLIPYSIAILWLDNADIKQKLAEIKEKPAGRLMHFKDDRGEIRFSTALENVLYIEASDNYSNIKYINGDRISDFMLHRKFKSLEEELINSPLVRCHRSYIINLLHVTSVKLEQDEATLEFDTTSIKNVTLTKTYQKAVMETFVKYSTIKQ